MAYNIPELYVDVMQLVRHGHIENTRLGEVKTILHPVTFRVENPKQRVLFDDKRQANPYFHVMETVWMLAGEDRVGWLAQFNSRMNDYADQGHINGAYGKRWREVGLGNQLERVIMALQDDPMSRQVVLQMWHAPRDLYPKKVSDRPCNTHIYFRTVRGHLNMTVSNRSNDAVWGMTGANAVHMTYLHEFVSAATGIPLGKYYVITNNLHLYKQHWELAESSIVYDDPYLDLGLNTYPIISHDESWQDILSECERFVNDSDFIPNTNWLRNVAYPMREAYKIRKAGGDETILLNNVAAQDWKVACIRWQRWHNKDTGGTHATEQST